MRYVLILAGLASAPAAAQLGGVAAPIQGVVSGSASAASRGGAGAVDPSPGSTVPVEGIVGGTRESRPVTGGRPVVRVRAGARVRATRETRCTDADGYYDPSYDRDGAYYCESRGPGVAAGAKVRAGG